MKNGLAGCSIVLNRAWTGPPTACMHILQVQDIARGSEIPSLCLWETLPTINGAPMSQAEAARDVGPEVAIRRSKASEASSNYAGTQPWFLQRLTALAKAPLAHREQNK